VHWDDVENSIFFDSNANFPKQFDIIEHVSINNGEYTKIGADNEDYPLRTIIHLDKSKSLIRFKYRKALEKYSQVYESINIALDSFPKNKDTIFTNYVNNSETVIKKLN